MNRHVMQKNIFVTFLAVACLLTSCSNIMTNNSDPQSKNIAVEPERKVIADDSEGNSDIVDSEEKIIANGSEENPDIVDSEEEIIENYSEENPNIAGSSSEIIAMYFDFMNGNISAEWAQGEISKPIQSYISDLFYNIDDEDDYKSYCFYALYDMNGDDMPELHIRSSSDYYILTYINEKLKVWGSFTEFAWPMNDRSVFETRLGGGPTHIRYHYQLFDFFGNTLFDIVFAKGDIDYNEVYDEKDDFIFDDVEIPKKYWDLLVEKYLNLENDLIVWHKFGEK